MAPSGFSQDELERLESEAVNLVVRLTSGEATEADYHAVQAWRRRGPAYERAFQKARRIWVGMEDLRDDLAGHRSVVVAARPCVGGASRRSWTTWSAVAATLAALAVILALEAGLVTRLTADYHTGTGERSIATLSDGSRLHLNTQAAVALHYTDSLRRVELLEGEAAFRVTKDAARPFVVQAQGSQIRAVGTEFLVQTMRDSTLVTVIEGAVEVRAGSDGQTDGSPVRVEAGRHVRYGRTSGVGPVEAADLRVATAWQRGKLVFEATPLSTVVDEINRYRPGRVVLLSDTLSHHPVSGVFDLDRLDSAVTTIEQTLPITTVRLTERFVLFR